MIQYPEIESNELLLKGPSYDDISDLHKVYGDKYAMSMLCLKNVSLDKMNDIIDQKITGFNELRELYFVIWLKSIKRVIGYIDIHYEDYHWNIDFCINKEYRNHGYGTASLLLVIDFCKKFGVKDLVAVVQNTNHISNHIIQQSGFQKTGDGVLYNPYDNTDEVLATFYSISLC